MVASSSETVLYGMVSVVDVTSWAVPSATCMKLNFRFMFFAMPAEKHANSSRMYSMNVASHNIYRTMEAMTKIHMSRYLHTLGRYVSTSTRTIHTTTQPRCAKEGKIAFFL